MSNQLQQQSKVLAEPRGLNRNTVLKFVRWLVPSVAALTRNRLVTLPFDVVDYLVALPFRELRSLPPNRLRQRVGNDQRVLFGHVDHITRSDPFWLAMFTEQAVKPDSTVLDIGCGCGRTAQTLRDSHFRHAPFFKGRYIGVDIDAEAVDWCKRNFPADRFSFYCLNKYSSVYNPSGRSGTKLELPIESGSVDFVICGSLFTHLLEDECITYLEEILRVLRPGGRAFTTFFCIDHLQSSRALGGKFTFNHRKGNAYVESLKYPEAAVAYEESYLLRTMREIGFSDVQVEAIQEGHGSQSTFFLRR